MYSAFGRTGALILSAFLLQSCGGGGGGDGKGPDNGPDPVPRMSVDKTRLSVSARPGDETPRGQVDVTVANPPEAGLYVGAEYTANGIASLDFTGSSASAGALQIYFMPTASIPNGVYEDTIVLHVCTDEACNHDIAGSPVTISTTYTIRNDRSASIDRTSVEFHTHTQNGDRPVEIVQLTIPDQPFGGAFVETEENGQGIDGVQLEGVDQHVTNVRITMQNGVSLWPGIYDDTITINVYYDNSRARHLEGSPFTVSSHVVVDAGAEPGLDPLQVVSRTVLTHDIVDAEYSKPLDAVVMSATWPENALYVYDVNSGAERKQALTAVPSAVSIAPDGLTAAVGHDALISVVDLTQAGQPGAPDPTLLDVSADVIDLVLDGHGKVHALERVADSQEIHTVDVATNVELLSTGKQLYGGSLGRLHPSGDVLYTADSPYISSDALNKWDLTVEPVAWISSTPFDNNHAICSNLWFKEDGTRIYTACGNTFRASTNPTTDMRFQGQLDLSGDRDFEYFIRSLSQVAATNEIALIEGELDGCYRIPPEAARCFTHLATFESESLARQGIFAITPLVVGDLAHAQRGLFVFHDAAGNRKILLSKLDGMPSHDAEYYLSIVN